MNVNKQEKAVFFASLPVDREDVAGFDRFYFGSETCDLLMPTSDELTTARKLAVDSSLSFTLMTPLLSDRKLSQFKSILGLLEEGDEVVVNDIGALRVLKRDMPHLTPVAGRLITRQARDPRFDLYRSKAESAAFVPSISTLDLLAEFGVRRIELSIPPYTECSIDLPENISASVYASYSLLSTTRICPWRISLAPESLNGKGCPQPCRNRNAFLRHSKQPIEYYLRWNTWFNTVSTDTSVFKWADRCVVQDWSLI